MGDAELIASLAGGDDTALRELFARHAPWLAARLRKALPSDDVEDVLQETFLAVWKNAKTYRPRGAPGGASCSWRNVIGITGIGLLTSLVTGGLLAWILPLGYLGFAEYALIEAWRSPWTWPARPPTDRGAWICAALVFA